MSWFAVPPTLPSHRSATGPSLSPLKGGEGPMSPVSMPHEPSSVQRASGVSRAGDDTPGQLTNSNRFDHLEGADIDHRDVVADPVCRVDPTLIRVEGEAPYALADQEVAHNLITLRIDNGNAVGRSERDEGELAVACDGNSDRLDRLVRHSGNREGDALDDIALRGVDDADRPADFGGNPELGAIGGPFGAARAAEIRSEEHTSE